MIVRFHAVAVLLAGVVLLPSPAVAQDFDLAACEARTNETAQCADRWVGAAFNSRLRQDYRSAEERARYALALVDRLPATRETRIVEQNAHAELAIIFNAVARDYEAEEQYRRSQLLAEELYGERSVENLLALLGLTSTLLDQGRSDEAYLIARRAVEIDDVTEYELKPTLSVSLKFNLGRVLQAQNRLFEAEGMLFEVAKLLYRRMNENFGFKGDDAALLAEAIAAQPDAETLEDFRGDLYQTAKLLWGLAEVCELQGENARCLEFAEASVRMFEALRPEWPSQHADAASRLATLYYNADRPLEAMAQYRSARDLYRSALGSRNINTAWAEADIAAVALRKLCRADDALAAARRGSDALVQSLAADPTSSESAERLKSGGNIFRLQVEAVWAVSHNSCDLVTRLQTRFKLEGELTKPAPGTARPGPAPTRSGDAEKQGIAEQSWWKR